MNIGKTALLLALLVSSVAFAKQVEIRISGYDDGTKSTKEQDYEEAVLFAKRQAIERAGVEIQSVTTSINLAVQKDYIEAHSERILLPGYQILDIGYLENGSYAIVLIGQIEIEEEEIEQLSRDMYDTQGVEFGAMRATWGMSDFDVKKAFRALTKTGGFRLNTLDEAYPIILTYSGRYAPTVCERELILQFWISRDGLYKSDITILNASPVDPMSFCEVTVYRECSEEEDSLYRKYGKEPIKADDDGKLWVLPSTAIGVELFRITMANDKVQAYCRISYEKR